MFKKRQLLDFFLLLIVSSLVFLGGISQSSVGLWEPWETSTLLTAKQMAQSSIAEPSFWVPELNETLVAQPYLQLWSLALILHLFPDPDAFMLRLPAGCIGIFLTLLTFLTVRFAASRRAAWISSLVLLTLPMFVLGGKLIHGGIWLVFAVSLPNLFYLLASYASTQRMHRVMLSLTALSTAVSFVAGGLFALAILLVEVLLFLLLIWRHPHKKYMIEPLKTRYFIFPLYFAFIFNVFLFGNYTTNVRYSLEHRIPMTLSEINDALDEDRVVTIERRQEQIIGSCRFISANPPYHEEQRPFVLVQSEDNNNSDASQIFESNDTERRTFENFLMWRFQKQYPSKAAQNVPPFDGALTAALKFFWYHSNSIATLSAQKLARVKDTALESSADLTIHSTDVVSSSISEVLALDGVSFETQTQLDPGTLVRVVSLEDDSEWAEIETGNGIHGFVKRESLDMLDSVSSVNFHSWIDVLLYGLLPWGFFFPVLIICMFIARKTLPVSVSPFRGEYQLFSEDETAEMRSPAQNLLISWTAVSIIALFVGTNHNNHVFFAGLIPIAIFFGFALASSQFWYRVRQSLEARLIYIVVAWGCMGLAIYNLYGEPFRLVRYLLTDPLMHWGKDTATVDAWTIFYIIAFIILTVISVSGIVEIIQSRVITLLEKHKKPGENTQNSSASFNRVTRESAEPMPYAPVIALLLVAALTSLNIYYAYIPRVSDEFTETALIQQYFELAEESEPIYLLTGENEQLCQTYRDCEPGYVCQNSHCQISTFSSYSLSVAHPISRDEMLRAIDPQHDNSPAFFVIPKDAIYGLNQRYRQMFDPQPRQNLNVIDAPSSRLYMIANHKIRTSINPLDDIIISELPEDATPIPTPIVLDDHLTIEGFRIDSLDFTYSNTLTMTIFYRVQQTYDYDETLNVNLELSGRKRSFKHSLLARKYDDRLFLPGDLIADSMKFEVHMMPNHGNLDVNISTENSSEHSLTMIKF